MAKRRGAGEGSIYKRKNGKGKSKWAAAIGIGHNEKGKPKRKTFYGATRKEANDKLTESLSKVNNGTYKEPAKIKLSEWLDTWLNDYKKHDLRSTTWESYESHSRLHIKPAIGYIKLSQLATTHLQRLYNDKLAGKRCDSKKGGLSAKTIREIHGVIFGALEQAKKEGMIAINPAGAVVLPKHETPDIKFFDNDQVAKFLTAAKETHYFQIYYLAVATGLRRGELLGLRWRDINLEARKISVNRSFIKTTKQGPLFHPPKTKRGKRTISIPIEVAGVLKFHERRQNNIRKEAGDAWHKELIFLTGKPEPNDLVFTNEIGMPLSTRALTRHFERLLDKVGLPKIAFHDLRHTFSTLSIQQGVDLKTLQKTLGHHSAAFTLDIYANVTDIMEQQGINKIGDLLRDCLNK